MAKDFFVGNGGSAAIASHMTADFMKNGGMNTYSLYDSCVTTCMGNDYGYKSIFSRPMEFLVREKDLIVVPVPVIQKTLFMPLRRQRKSTW